MADPNIYIDSVNRQARRGGIKTVTGEFRRVDRLGASASSEASSVDCLSKPAATPLECWGVLTGDATKSLDGIVTVGGAENFAIYLGVECFLGGDNYRDRAAELFTAWEDRAVEERLVAFAAAETSGVPLTGSNAAVIGGLEELADADYVGLPVLVVSRAIATAGAAEDIFHGDGTGALWTVNGTPVIATSAMSDTTAYIIGMPTVLASEMVVSDSLNLTLNMDGAVAERVYGLFVDCGFVRSGTVAVA